MQVEIAGIVAQEIQGLLQTGQEFHKGLLKAGLQAAELKFIPEGQMIEGMFILDHLKAEGQMHTSALREAGVLLIREPISVLHNKEIHLVQVLTHVHQEVTALDITEVTKDQIEIPTVQEVMKDLLEVKVLLIRELIKAPLRIEILV